MKYDYSKLLGRITEYCGTVKGFTQKMGLSQRSITQKIHNRNSWKQKEIEKAITILNIPREEIAIYFFNLKTQSIE